MKALPGQKDGMVLLEYVGGNYGDQTWWGETTNQRYVFGLGRPQGYVDARDADELVKKRHNRKRLFRVADRPQPQPKVPVEKQAEANPPAVKEKPETEPDHQIIITTHSITPRAQEVAEELGVDWKRIVGTGAGEKITVHDVRTAA